MSRIGLIVNPAAGRDVRRLTGGASVVDDYSKRRVAECVLDGLTAALDPPSVGVMPETAGIAADIVDGAPEGVDVETIDAPVEGSAADTRRAAARFREDADAVVVLGGDGTTRDAALELGEVPLVSVSTGTNNVVPSPVDGTVAGAAAALVASGAVEPAEATDRHGMVEARIDAPTGEKRVTGLASVEVSDRSFVGTRALIDPADLRGGVVVCAHPAAIGLSGVAGCVCPLAPDADGGASLRLADPEDAVRTVRAIVAPGMASSIGVAEHRRLGWGEPVPFDVDDGVIGADGERELELVDARVEVATIPDGPRLVDVNRTLETAASTGALLRDRAAIEEG